MPRKKHPCIVCGTPTWGERCKRHNAQHEVFLALERTRDEDHELLELLKAGLAKSSIAERYGVTRSAMQERIDKALNLEALRERLDSGMEIEFGETPTIAGAVGAIPV